MPSFCRVEDEQAGPSALGILLPPGRRTLLIIRPRALDWDLLPVYPDVGATESTRFWELSRELAPRVAQEFLSALEDGAGTSSHRVEAAAAPDGSGYQVHACVGRFVLVACERVPGQPYQPLIFATVAEACAAVERISAYLCPAPDAGQEVYLNTRHFAQ